MTVWRDKASLDAFVRSEVHTEAIRMGMPAVKTAQFLRFEWPAQDVPPSWGEVERRLSSPDPNHPEDHPRTYGPATRADAQPRSSSSEAAYEGSTPVPPGTAGLDARKDGPY
jgi:hypothetical protein